jgi:hypothetical protein
LRNPLFDCCGISAALPLWREWQAIIDGSAEILFAPDVSLRCLNGCMAEQKLDLLQFAAGGVA